MFKVTAKVDNRTVEIDGEKGQSLLELLRKAGLNVDTPCNGNGTCGKCSVKVLSGCLPEPLPNELKLLGAKAVQEGYRLSCNYQLKSDIELELEAKSTKADIVTEGVLRKVELMPIVTKERVKLDKPGLEDQRADFERVMQRNFQTESKKADGQDQSESYWQNGFAELSPNGTDRLELIRLLPEILRQQDFEITLVKSGERLLGVEAGDTSRALYGVAIDIGTTTLAAYLIDLNTGERLAVQPVLNPQKSFGGDVISRIKHTIDNIDGLEELHSLIISAVNECITELCRTSKISQDEIYAVTLVGNTTMTHFLLKVSAKHIATAPFIPAVTSMVSIKASELGIYINQFGLVNVLPCVSAYIGADTVGAVLSTGFYEEEAISLLVDLGTNGEIVLGNKDILFACSAAAGPAFEGANIRNGVGSIAGAISKVSLVNGINYSTIGNSEPVGICGTGLVDAIAQMLEIGLIDETGRLDTSWEPIDIKLDSLKKNIIKADGINAFALTDKIAITQKDIREFQNAKAAIAAGINVLVKEAGISFEQIENVYLAGGFGSYINVDNALKLGMIPGQLKGKVKSVGNAAGQGAIEGLVSTDSLATANEISKGIKYIELSASKDFNDFYIDCMLFE